MKGAVLYGPRDVRFEERGTPKIVGRRTQLSGHRRRASAGPIYGPTGA